MNMTSLGTEKCTYVLFRQYDCVSKTQFMFGLSNNFIESFKKLNVTILKEQISVFVKSYCAKCGNPLRVWEPQIYKVKESWD